MLRIRSFTLVAATAVMLSGAVAAAPLRAQSDARPTPLLVVNGVALTGITGADQAPLLEAIAPAIESVEVLKGPLALQRFGAPGSGGVILITLRGNAARPQEGARRAGKPEVGVGAAAAPEARPLVVIDGVVATRARLETLEPRNIDKVEILRGTAAIEAFGDRAAGGVIQITTRTPRMP